MYEIDRSIEDFIPLLRKQMFRNKHKGDWRKLSKDELIVYLWAEIVELYQAMDEGDIKEIQNKAANVGNYAMMISYKASRCGGQ